MIKYVKNECKSNTGNVTKIFYKKKVKNKENKKYKKRKTELKFNNCCSLLHHLRRLFLPRSLDHEETEILCSFVHQSVGYLCGTLDKHIL